MSEHNHSEHVPGCFRCDLTADELGMSDVKPEWVEAAAQSLYEQENPTLSETLTWFRIKRYSKDKYRARARATLAAVVPLIHAEHEAETAWVCGRCGRAPEAHSLRAEVERLRECAATAEVDRDHWKKHATAQNKAVREHVDTIDELRTRIEQAEEASGVALQNLNDAAADIVNAYSERDAALAERDSLRAQVAELVQCEQGIHPPRSQTPNGKCPWCEWENVEQQSAEYERQIAAVADALARLNEREARAGDWTYPSERRLQVFVKFADAVEQALDAPDDHLRAVERAAAAKALREAAEESASKCLCCPASEHSPSPSEVWLRARADQIEGGTEPTDSDGAR